MMVPCKSALRLHEEPHLRKNGDDEPIPEEDDSNMLTLGQMTRTGDSSSQLDTNK